MKAPMLSLVAITAAALTFFSPLVDAMPKSKKPHPVARYCQQAVTNHPHHKHVLVDAQTGDVTWTRHDGSLETYRERKIGGVTVGSRHLMSDKSLTWCRNHGWALPPPGVKP